MVPRSLAGQPEIGIAFPFRFRNKGAVERSFTSFCSPRTFLRNSNADGKSGRRSYAIAQNVSGVPIVLWCNEHSGPLKPGEDTSFAATRAYPQSEGISIEFSIFDALQAPANR